jgi:hypothetical protein
MTALQSSISTPRKGHYKEDYKLTGSRRHQLSVFTACDALPSRLEDELCHTNWSGSRLRKPPSEPPLELDLNDTTSYERRHHKENIAAIGDLVFGLRYVDLCGLYQESVALLMRLVLRQVQLLHAAVSACPSCS